MRVCDLMDPEELRKKLAVAYPVKKAYVEALGGSLEQGMEDILKEYEEYGRVLAPLICDASVLVNEALDSGKRVLLEGAQGVHLDIDHGIYPHGTSSSTVSGGCCTGAGIAPKRLGDVIGVVKAYTSRVGTGPFPTELKGDLGELIAERGGEVGTTTGRKRRVGWLDMVMIRYSIRLCGINAIALTKADVLDGIPTIKACTHYMHNGREMHDFPASMKVLSECRPEYHSLDGWYDMEEPEWEACRKGGRSSLPRELQDFVTFIEANLGVPVELLSYGPQRNANVILGHMFS